MAKKISKLPSSTNTISGYTDHPTNAVRKVTDSKYSISSMLAPKAIIAPPQMYSLPLRKYRSSTTTVVTISPILTVVGSANTDAVIF